MFFLLLSCNSDNTLVFEKEVDRSPDPPDIFITPNPINFNHVDALDEDIMSIYISNIGDESLDISSIYLDGDIEFNINNNESVILESGEQKEISITFNPLEYNYYFSNLIIKSNDFDEEVSFVPVEGYGDAAKIKITPEEYDFNSTSIPCFEYKDITISNVGNKNLEIDSLSISATVPQDFNLDYNFNINGPLSWTLEPNQSLDVTIEYNPKDVTQDNLYLETLSNDPINSNKINIYKGNGFIAKEMTELFEISDMRIVDIIFIIDNSGSMYSFQNSLSSHFSDFLNIFLNYNIDYRIAVITTDNPIFIGDFIDNSTQDPISEFMYKIQSATIHGSGHEIGLEMAYEATILYPNFIRNNALLSLVFLSDEPDHSSQSVNYYYNHFVSLKTDPSQLKINSIIGDYPSGCQYNYFYAQFGDRYYDLSILTGGNIYSICAADWGIQMQSLATSSAGSNSFYLSEDPIVSSIEVFVEGQINYDWTYDESINSIIFDQGYLPNENEEIRVDYGVLSDCP